VRGIRSNSVLLFVAAALALLLFTAAAQAPTEKPAAQQQATQAQNAQGQPVSQPGAQGQSQAATVPAVPVPPGPVPPQEIKPAPPTPIATKKVELGSDNTWDPQWDVLIEENLPPELLSSEAGHAVRSYCPRYSVLPEADRRAFWAYMFQALAGAEAGLKPTSDVRHTEPEVAVVDKVTHRIVRQQGLLQLTYEDSDRYGCEFDWDKDKQLNEHDPGKTILQPKNNLLCGIRIMKNQLIDLHEPLLTTKSYWSTLRPGTPSYRVFAKQMTNAPAVCSVRGMRNVKSADSNVRIASVSHSAGQGTGGGGTQ
jgi:hypothetical protein